MLCMLNVWGAGPGRCPVALHLGLVTVIPSLIVFPSSVKLRLLHCILSQWDMVPQSLEEMVHIC